MSANGLIQMLVTVDYLVQKTIAALEVCVLHSSVTLPKNLKETEKVQSRDSPTTGEAQRVRISIPDESPHTHKVRLRVVLESSFLRSHGSQMTFVPFLVCANQKKAVIIVIL